MARIVELCGIPGVGKSTIFKKMIAMWNNGSDWVPGHFLYPQEKLKFDSLSKLLLSFERKYTISEGNVDERVLKEYGDRFLASYPDYINACWNNIFIKNNAIINGKDIRFDKARYLYCTLQKFQFLKENKTSRVSLLEEGLVHRLTNGLFWKESLAEEEDELFNLIELLPLPDAIIYVETDVEEIARRLFKRKKVTISHQSLSLGELEDLSLQSLERMNYVINALGDRQIPVLHIDSKNEIEANAKVIISFVEKVSKRESVS